MAVSYFFDEMPGLAGAFELDKDSLAKRETRSVLYAPTTGSVRVGCATDCLRW